MDGLPTPRRYVAILAVSFGTALAVIDVVLMVKFARKGPDGLGLWPYTKPAPAASTIPAQA